MILPGTPKQVRTTAETGADHITVTDAPDGPPTDWVGAAPWLTTDDQLTSYAYGIGGTGFPAKVAWLVDPVAGLSGDLTVSTSSTYAEGSSTSVGLYVHDLATLTSVGADLVDDALATGDTFNPDGSWTVRARTFAVTPAMASAAAAGRLVIVALIGDAMRLSFLLVEGGARVHKLRQYNRDDGLGVAPRRAYGGASRNHTGRAYGYT